MFAEPFALQTFNIPCLAVSILFGYVYHWHHTQMTNLLHCFEDVTYKYILVVTYYFRQSLLWQSENVKCNKNVNNININ